MVPGQKSEVSLRFGLRGLLAITGASVAAATFGVVAALLVGDDRSTEAASPVGTHHTAKALVSRSLVLSSDDWMEMIRSEEFWRSRKKNNGDSGAQAPTRSERMSLGVYGIPADSGRWRSEEDWSSGRFGGGTYRTMCVRLCDGYFFPVSYSTTSDRFAADEAKCQSSCGASPSRLFVYPNPGADIDDMRDLQGRMYRKLKSAFLFRTTYDNACTCKAHPWEQEALNRHKSYADAAAAAPVKRAGRDRSGSMVAAVDPAKLSPAVTSLNDVGGGPLATPPQHAVRTFAGTTSSLVVVNAPAIRRPLAQDRAGMPPPVPLRRTDGRAEQPSTHRSGVGPQITRLGVNVPSSAASKLSVRGANARPSSRRPQP